MVSILILRCFALLRTANSGFPGANHCRFNPHTEVFCIVTAGGLKPLIGLGFSFRFRTPPISEVFSSQKTDITLLDKPSAPCLPRLSTFANTSRLSAEASGVRKGTICDYFHYHSPYFYFHSQNSSFRISLFHFRESVYQ